MAVIIRLARRGKKKQPYYRIVAADQRFSRDGRFLEIVGTYDPRKDVSDVKKEQAEKWVKNGAKISATVKKIFSKHGVAVTSK
ncbi:MAG: 30S ribosomal protein S16 [Nitrospinota bacterium]